MLGEATHGSDEFHRERARILRRLVAEKGFRAILAASRWGDKDRVKTLLPALPESYTGLFHTAGPPRFLLLFRSAEPKLAELPAVEPARGGGTRTGERLYNAICVAYHGAGVAGSPKMGDKAAWAPRIGVVLDVLVKSATVGKNAMPPRGGSDATDEELARAIVYMTNKSGANFREPAAGAKPATNERNPEQITQTVCFKCMRPARRARPGFPTRRPGPSVAPRASTR